MGEFCTIETFLYQLVGQFCTFQDGICVVWVCFAVHFSQPKMSQNLYCVPLVAHHEWESFVPMKFFLYQLVQKKFH
jgi:hypothetical protein